MTQRAASEFFGAPWRVQDPAVLGAAAGVPTMLARDEQLFYHWITAHWARGHGAIVDLGCFVGGSTARLAEGHRKAGFGSVLHAYDRFTASAGVKQRFLYAAGIARFGGTDTLALTARLLQPWRERIDLHPGPIEAQSWSGGPIEVLVMDASKTTRTTDHMAAQFFPHLLAGRSLVVQQDYLHWRQPWVAAQMARMADWFTPVAAARDHTVAFLCTRPVTRQALEAGRCHDRAAGDTRDALIAARHQMRPLHLAAAVGQLIRAHRANPGIDAARDMVRPPRNAKDRPEGRPLVRG